MVSDLMVRMRYNRAGGRCSSSVHTLQVVKLYGYLHDLLPCLVHYKVAELESTCMVQDRTSTSQSLPVVSKAHASYRRK